jgi:hypothetical protein
MEQAATKQDVLRRINLMLGDSELAWLAQAAEHIRQNGGGNLSRSELVRGVVAGVAGLVKSLRLRFHGVRTEYDFATALVQYFEGLAKGRVR